MAQSPDTDGIAGPNKSSVPNQRNEAREINVYTLDKGIVADGMDFRPIPVNSDTPDDISTDPKDLSAAERADSSDAATEQTSPSSAPQVKTAVKTAVKDSTQPKE